MSRKSRKREAAKPESTVLLGGDPVSGEGLHSRVVEPSIVDRVAGLGSSKIAARNRAYDKLVAERERMIQNLTAASNEIHKRTVRANTNWVLVTDPALAKQLDPTGEFTEEVDVRDLNL